MKHSVASCSIFRRTALTKLLWKIEASDVRRVKAFYDEQKDNALVVWRYRRNIERDVPVV